MNKNIEKEYKLLVTKEQFERLLSYYPDAVFKEQTNTYYDTEDHAIQKKQGAMRIREKNGTFLFTLKMHSDRGLLEYEKRVEENSIRALEDPQIKDLLSSYDIQGDLKAITFLTTKRAMIDTGYAELCFDENHYHGYCDYEIEYEYKKEHDGLSAFQKILAPLHIRYKQNCKSKIQRAIECL